jgi:hypothetical protein
MKKTNLGWLWMLLCCLSPLFVILVLALGGWNFGSFVYVIALLICPLSMLFMMFSGRGSHRSSQDEDEPKDR